MGDYNFSVSSSVTALPPVDFQQNSNGTSLFFSSDSVTHTMQDDLLLEKSAGKQPQQLSPATENTTNGEQTLEDFSGRNQKNEDTVPDVNAQNEKKILDSSNSGTSSSPLQLGFSEPSSTINITSTTPSFWSTVATDDTFIQGISAMNGTLSFPNFASTGNVNPMLNTNLGPQINIPQQPQRRAITGAHNFPQNRHQPQPNLFKTYTNWSSPHQTTWSAPQTPNALSTWNTVNLANHKRSVPNMSPISPLKKTSPNMGQHSMVISPSKFRRSTSMPVGKPFPHALGANTNYDLTGDESRDGNVILPFQDRQMPGNITSPLDNLRFPLEQQLLDIMRTTVDSQDHYKGKSPFFTGLEDNHLLDDSHLDQIVPSLNSSLLCSPKSQGSSETGERYSRKVFVGGLPPDIDEGK